MAAGETVIPPLPDGFRLDSESEVPPLPAGFKLDQPEPLMGGVAGQMLGVPDTMVALGSGMAAAPLSGVAGILGTILPGPAGQGADWTRKVGNALTYQPRTEMGAATTNLISLPFEALHKGAVSLGQKAQDAGAPPSVATGVQTAVEAIPAVLPFGLRATKPALESGATSLMRQALKPTKGDVLTGKADSAIKTMLEDGTMPTKGGLEKMRAELDALDAEITQAVANSNGSVNKLAIGRLLSAELNKVRKQANPNAAIKDVRDAWVEFVNHPLLQNSNLIPVKLAQEMKRETYKALGNKAWDQQKTPSAEAQKVIARGLKEGVAAAVPEAAPINARMSNLINASDVLEGRLATSGNRGLGMGALSPHSSNLIAWLLDHSDAGKGGLGNILYKASRQGAGPNNLSGLIMEAQQAEEARK